MSGRAGDSYTRDPMVRVEQMISNFFLLVETSSNKLALLPH